MIKLEIGEIYVSNHGHKFTKAENQQASARLSTRACGISSRSPILWHLEPVTDPEHSPVTPTPGRTAAPLQAIQCWLQPCVWPALLAVPPRPY
jgi:hypothetical protein